MEKETEAHPGSLLFVGSQPEGVDSHDWATVGKALGMAAVRQSFRLLVGSDSSKSLDRQVMKGALQAHRETGRPINWQLYELNDERRGHRYAGERWRELPRPTSEHHEPSTDGWGRWKRAHLAALDSADAVIALGGKKNTRTLCRFAEERGVLTLPVPVFGGEASESFERLSGRRRLEPSPGFLDEWRELLQGVTARTALAQAEKLLGKLRRFVGRKIRRRLYFISYARRDEEAADQIDLFLRRRERGVLRDETEFPPGGRLTREVERVLAEADDVVVLTSDAARGSKWVKFEVELCRSLRKERGRPPDRLVAVTLDASPPGLGFHEDELYLPGASRSERERAVDNLVNKEP